MLVLTCTIEDVKLLLSAEWKIKRLEKCNTVSKLSAKRKESFKELMFGPLTDKKLTNSANFCLNIDFRGLTIPSAIKILKKRKFCQQLMRKNMGSRSIPNQNQKSPSISMISYLRLDSLNL
jgi:hypothetical protein